MGTLGIVVGRLVEERRQLVQEHKRFVEEHKRFVEELLGQGVGSVSQRGNTQHVLSNGQLGRTR